MPNLAPLPAFLVLILFASCNATEPDSGSIGPEADAEGVTAEISTLWGAQFGTPAPELLNIPRVHAREKPDADGRIEVTVHNPGETTLLYFGYGPAGPQYFTEVRGENDWETAGWDWCGTGMERYSIAPGESVVLRVHFSSRTEGQETRVLTGFQEEDSDRRSYVILATR